MDHDFDTEDRRCSLSVATSRHPPTQRVIIDRIHARADEIRRHELETAFSMLETRGEFTDEQRAIVKELADALVVELLESPTTHLQNECVTRSELQTVAELFLSSPFDKRQ